MARLRPMLLGAGLTEEIERGEPGYSHESANVVILQEMQEVLALVSFRGALLADPDRCKACGQCVVGCPNDAKWNATRYLDEAIDDGADVVYQTAVKRVLIEQGKAVGVQGIGPRGKSAEYRAKAVVL